MVNQKTQNIVSPFYTCPEVAELTRWSVKQVRRRARAGDIPGMLRLCDGQDNGRRGPQLLFSRKAVNRWISLRCEAAGVEPPRLS